MIKQIARFTVVIAAFISVVGGESAHAATLDVCLSGCSYSSISSAVTAAAAGDTITIGPGTYSVLQVVISKPLTIIGAGSGRDLRRVGGSAGHVERRIAARGSDGKVDSAGRPRCGVRGDLHGGCNAGGPTRLGSARTKGACVGSSG